MPANKINTLLLTLLTLWFGIFGMQSGYALTLIETQKLLASDGIGEDSFGFSVSISGDTAMIGSGIFGFSGTDSETVYVFVRDNTGAWHEQQKLTASDGVEGQRFGESVSISGDTVVIGAHGRFVSNGIKGSAYVFVRDSAGVWRERQKLTASDPQQHGNDFGGSVSINGDTAVIGAYSDDENAINSGSAYVFVRNSSGMWSEQQKLKTSDGEHGDLFGISVSISGDTAVIGALGDDGNTPGGFRYDGSAYVFVRDSAGNWSEHKKLIASDGIIGGERFGESVSISGDTVVIGANHEGYGNDGKSGSAYVFVRDSTGMWSEQQKLIASDGEAADRFGGSVSISGNTAVIGAYLDDDNGIDSGSAYVFSRDSNGVWHEQQKLSTRYSWGDWFGLSVSISGDSVMIGAPFNDDNGTRSGITYVFVASDPKIEKLINHRVRATPETAAQLLVGTRYRADYKVTNNSPNRIYSVQVFEGGQLVCNLYALDPGQSKQPYRCTNYQDVLPGFNNVPANVTAKVSGSNQTLTNQTDAYYTGFGNAAGKLKVTHYVNEKNADTGATAVTVNSDQAVVKFRVENTGSITLYRVKLYHDPASPVNSGWQELCFKGTLVPGEVRYCKRTIDVTHGGLNKAFGRAQASDTNVGLGAVVNASNPTYFNVLLP